MSRTVVIVGGGYGGSALAKALESEADVVLIDPRDAFVNSAGSLRALCQPDWAPNMFYPFETLLTKGRVIQDRVVSVDERGVTLLSGERVDADYLVLATGSDYAYPAKPSADTTAESLEGLRHTHGELAAAQAVLILGAGPVGLELAGEIKEVWPDKQVTVVDPAPELLPTFEADMREDLHRQLDQLGIHVRLGTSLATSPPTPAAQIQTFTVTSTTGEEITADIWFRAYGVSVNSDYLADGRLTTRTPQGQVRVTETLNVRGPDVVHANVYAIGDLTDLAEAKMAGYAMQHADVVAKNIIAQLRGEQPDATYQPLPHPMILLPLGPSGGVGQLPSPEGPTVVTAETVSQYKGGDLFTGRFTQQLGPTAAATNPA